MKMRNARGQQGKNERQWKKKQTNKQTNHSEQEHKQHFFFLEQIGHFLHKMCSFKVSRCSRAKQRQRND